ncbi:hypothetical protein [Wenyingzhuangia marina]|uniref:Uncharacterized protein n=1 Tax=Wenyingzhuangia marina TaxID=1195760 RepID=A0A1M5U5J7_9FLAO|nr:hypothetical protein [Wenyingzhuangia marina]GGF69499.1 hypothetical protein GCM10011397_10530 [Wenyingzhuangia marina]SHH58208.1 hypothetical protein SAMN05444281_1044 [Wenyingzhuangia marina]
METKGLIQVEKKTQKIQIVKGDFTPSEASQVIMSLIDEKINFHKIQRLQKWEQNHQFDTNNLDNRINQLIKEKEIAKTFITKSENLNCNMSINGTIEISIEE